MPALLTASDVYASSEEITCCNGSELRLAIGGRTLHCCLPGAIDVVDLQTQEQRRIIAWMLSTMADGSVEDVQFAAESLGQHSCELHPAV